MSDDQAIFDARALMQGARVVVALTGAGMSAESGVPTFRQGHDGLWAQYSAEQLATPKAWRDDCTLVWGWYLWRMAIVRDAMPNTGHVALALAGTTIGLRVITQNVDDLHERAGSEDVIHLHGGLFEHRCFACARPHSNQLIPESTATPLRVEPPRCGHCGGRIRPGVVWFSEPMPERPWKQAEMLARDCDVMLVIGTSGIVYPAADLPAIAKRNGAQIT